MLKKLAVLDVRKSDDYHGKVVKALEAAGFVVVRDIETTFDATYTIAEQDEEDEEEYFEPVPDSEWDDNYDYIISHWPDKIVSGKEESEGEE